MGVIESGAWGLAGGLAAGLISLMAAVVAAGFRWPWQQVAEESTPPQRHVVEEVWPRLFVMSGGPVVGALVAAAASAQMSGPWPAFIMGVSAPSMVRGMLSRVEVTERKPNQVIGDPNQVIGDENNGQSTG